MAQIENSAECVRQKRVLLSFTGFHDPFVLSGIAGSDQEGPVLSMVRQHSFDQVYLFSTPQMVPNTQRTAIALRERHPELRVGIHEFSFQDPTDYFSILASLRASFSEIASTMPGAEYHIATASGTPQMHACWLLLAASGEIPARLLHAKNTKFATSDAPVVTEVDLSRPEFPRVRSNSLHHFEVEDGDVMVSYFQILWTAATG